VVSFILLNVDELYPIEIFNWNLNSATEAVTKLSRKIILFIFWLLFLFIKYKSSIYILYFWEIQKDSLGLSFKVSPSYKRDITYNHRNIANILIVFLNICGFQTISRGGKTSPSISRPRIMFVACWVFTVVTIRSIGIV